MTRDDATPLPPPAAALAAAGAVLETYAAGPPDRPSHGEPRPDDAGPAILASLLAACDRPGANGSPSLAVSRWLDSFRTGHHHMCAFEGGLPGLFVGACVAAPYWPRLHALAAHLRGLIQAWSTTPARWRVENVAWADYDLTTGPAGIVLALSVDHGCPPEVVSPAVVHLLGLCHADDLAGLRVGAYRGEELRGWNFGRINTGLAHGVTGVAAALGAAIQIVGQREDLRLALERVARWLIAQSFTDARGVTTWASAELDGGRPPRGASRRQAWCYGTPGVSWTLWEAGRALGDADVADFAADAFGSFCAAYDDSFYLDTLGICHGAAGLLAITDAFTRSGGLQAAALLRGHVMRYLLDRLEAVCELATEDASLLTGASGVLSVLLTASGADRDWLRHIAVT
jgi:lantibiotic biosynthesis protein